MTSTEFKIISSLDRGLDWDKREMGRGFIGGIVVAAFDFSRRLVAPITMWSDSVGSAGRAIEAAKVGEARLTSLASGIVSGGSGAKSSSIAASFSSSRPRCRPGVEARDTDPLSSPTEKRTSADSKLIGSLWMGLGAGIGACTKPEDVPAIEEGGMKLAKNGESRGDLGLARPDCKRSRLPLLALDT